MLRTKFNLETTEMFLDTVFSKYNVYNITFSFHGEDTSSVPVNILSLSKFHLVLLQECSDFHCKFTFVTPLDLNSFNNMLSQLVRLISKIDCCSINYV